MVLYEIPNIRFDSVQVDIYTTFRGDDAQAVQRCILSALVERDRVREVDWERDPPEEFIEDVTVRCSVGPEGRAQPIDAVPLVGSPA
jgi:hypothetical protein